MKETTENNKVSNNVSPTFCVAMLKNGSTIKLEGKVEEFMQTIKDADFAWVNVQVDDLENEGSKVASTARLLKRACGL